MKSLIALALIAVSSSAMAQNYNQQAQPITHTYTVSGRIIAVDRPITRQVQRGQSCDQQQSDYDQGYQQQYPNQGYPQQQYQESDLNAGSVVGAIIGGALGSRVGKGSGRDVAIGVGAATGAMIGNSNSRSNSTSNYRPQQQNYQQRCYPIFEEVIVGYNYIAQYEHYQIRGQMRSMPKIGQPVEITIRSTLYIENRGL